MEDKDLLVQFQDPDLRNAAFNALVQKYQRKVYWLVRRMVIDHDDANDLTQDVFVKVWNHLDNFRQDSALYTWLYRVASNECLQFLNKKKRFLFVDISDSSKELEQKLDSGAYMEADEMQLKFQKAMLRLPEKQRLTFQLRYYDELPYSEIAAITGTSEGALKANYHHAVKKIEDYIKNEI